MAQDNQISATLSPEEVQSLQKLIEKIKQTLPFLVNLTALERQTYPRMSDKTVAFVAKALEYGRQNPNLIPPYLQFDEFEKDMALLKQLNVLLIPLRSLVEALDDSAMLVGSESYSAALTFYNSVRAARKMNVPGITTIYNDLRERFPGRGTAASQATDSQNNDVPPADGEGTSNT